MATVKSKIILRNGDIQDLPILDPAEMAYAKNTNRVFIGNTPIVTSAIDNGGVLSAAVPVDLDLVYKYAVYIGTAPNYTDITCITDVNDFVMTFRQSAIITSSTPATLSDPSNYERFEIEETVIGSISGHEAIVKCSPSPTASTPSLLVTYTNIAEPFVVGETLTGQTSGVSMVADTIVDSPISAGDEITVKYNTEILTYQPDKEFDETQKMTLSGSSTGSLINAIVIDETRYNNAEIKYSLRDGTNVRTGTLTVSLLGTTFNIMDNYVSNDDDALPHIFNGTLSNGIFTLNYTTTSNTTVDFTFVTNYWKS